MYYACTLMESDFDELSNRCEKNRLTVNSSKAMLSGIRQCCLERRISSTPPLTVLYGH